MPENMDVFTICEFATKPEGSVKALRTILAAGMPVNVVVGDIRAEQRVNGGNHQEIQCSDPQAGMLHVIASSVDPNKEEEVSLAGELIDVLFQFGASWMLLDGHNRTPGCICLERKLPSVLYDRFVRAGVRSEIFLQRMTEPEDDTSPEVITCQNGLRAPQNTATPQIEAVQARDGSTEGAADRSGQPIDESLSQPTPAKDRSFDSKSEPNLGQLKAGSSETLLDASETASQGAKRSLKELSPDSSHESLHGGSQSSLKNSRVDASNPDSASEGQQKHGGPSASDQPSEHPEGNQQDYLSNKLVFTDGAILTDQNDGVMMDWETPIMKRSAEIVAKPSESSKERGTRVLNIGFGMGIIDEFIQEWKPAKHYIVEAHEAVLQKMRRDGWYDRPGVVILEGPWREKLPELLNEGITFDGIYYDTFSEHYLDMLDLFDYVCGLLEFDGTFSFFNGLGADRQICYDVYKEVVSFDVQDHGLEVTYEPIPVELPKSTWSGIKHSYFQLSEYALPILKFMS